MCGFSSPKSQMLACKEANRTHLYSVFYLVNISVYFSPLLHAKLIYNSIFNKYHVWFYVRQSLVANWILSSEVFIACAVINLLSLYCAYEWNACQWPLYFSSCAHLCLLVQTPVRSNFWNRVLIALSVSLFLTWNFLWKLLGFWTKLDSRRCNFNTTNTCSTI